MPASGPVRSHVVIYVMGDESRKIIWIFGEKITCKQKAKLGESDNDLNWDELQ